eukprot:968321-Pleurochrysis_carterae.AAC.8
MLCKKQQHSRRVQQQQLRKFAWLTRTTSSKFRPLALPTSRVARRFEQKCGWLVGTQHRAAAHAESRKCCCPCYTNKDNAAAISELEAQVQRLNEGRIWARVRDAGGGNKAHAGR